MSANGNFFVAIAQVLDIALTFYMYIIIISALMSWVNPDPNNPIVRFLHRATEPVLRPVRRAIPLSMGVDFSPLIVILGIVITKKLLVAVLMEMAGKLG